MSQEERTGERDLSYNIWHRAMSLQRYMDMSLAEAEKILYYDIDGAETYFYKSQTTSKWIGYPLFYVETAKYTRNYDTEKRPKAALGAAYLSSHPPEFMSKCYVVQYKTNGKINKFNASKNVEVQDLEELYVKRFFPFSRKENPWMHLTPEKWANELLRIREEQTKKLINYLRGK